jgi:hypothetical protein
LIRNPDYFGAEILTAFLPSEALTVFYFINFPVYYLLVSCVIDSDLTADLQAALSLAGN